MYHARGPGKDRSFPGPHRFSCFALSLSDSIICIFRSPKRVSKEIDCPGPKGNITIRAESLPFSVIPGQSKLFKEYQNDPESLRRFYPNAVRSHTQIAERIPEVLANYKADRQQLCDAL